MGEIWNNCDVQKVIWVTVVKLLDLWWWWWGGGGGEGEGNVLKNCDVQNIIWLVVVKLSRFVLFKAPPQPIQFHTIQLLIHKTGLSVLNMHCISSLNNCKF